MLTGSIVALVTPMRIDGSVDWGALDRLIEWHIDSGTHGIVPMGTTGEAPLLLLTSISRLLSELSISWLDAFRSLLAPGVTRRMKHSIKLKGPAPWR